MQDYREPLTSKKQDYIADAERRMGGVIDDAKTHFSKVVDQIAPHAIGATKSTPDEALHDYIINIAQAPDPVAAGEQWVKDKSGQYGPAKAIEMFLDMTLANEKKLRSFEGK